MREGLWSVESSSGMNVCFGCAKLSWLLMRYQDIIISHRGLLLEWPVVQLVRKVTRWENLTKC